MKELWIILGFFTFILGVLGIFLPILPTTPFFLVTGYSFSKGSERFTKWFHNIPFVQKHVGKMTMTKRKKWTINIGVDILLITYLLVFESFIIRIVLLSVIVIKHFVFYKYVSINK